MADKYFKCIKRIKGTHLEKLEGHKNAGNKQKENTLLVPDAPDQYADIIIRADKGLVYYNNWKDGDKNAKISFYDTMDSLDRGYYENGVNFEQVANTTSNHLLFGLLGYKPYKTTVTPEKKEISVVNTDVMGELEFDLRTYNKVKGFDVQGRIITDGVIGATIGFPSLTECKGTVVGFESGALYQVRTRPSFTNGKKGEWSPWVEIRVT